MSTKAPLEPQPPDLQPPWRTAARVELQLEARTFARDIVLPIADELDPQKGEMPRSLIDEMAAKGWFGITVPAEHGGMGLGVFEYCLVSEELPALGFRSAASWRGARDWVRKRSTTPVGSNCCVVRPRANGSGQSLYLSQPPVLTSLPSRPEPSARMAIGYYREPSGGGALLSPPTSLKCSPERASPRMGNRARPALKTFLVVKQPRIFPDGMTGHDKIGYHGFLTWHLELDRVRVSGK